MKTTTAFLPFCLLLTITLALNGCRKEGDSGCAELFPVAVSVLCDTTVDPEVQRDAYELAMKDYLNIDLLPLDAYFPETKWRPYVRLLNAVRAAIPQIECEDLDHLLSVRPVAPVSLDELILELDGSFPWVDAWRNGNVLTGNSVVDSLVVRYQLSLDDFSAFSTLEYAILSGAEPLNMRQLAVEFSTVSGILSTETSPRIGDGDNIDVTYEADGAVVVISKGYGDCPSGCINRDNWTFRVDENCLVHYEGFETQ